MRGSMKAMKKEFLRELSARNLSSNTVELYGFALDLLLKHLETAGIGRIRNVTPRHISQYRLALVRRKLAPATLQICLRVVRLFFHHLESTQKILINPATDIPPVRAGRTLMPVPSEEDVERLLLSVDTSSPVGARDRALLETAYSTGARLGELAGMELRDVELRHGTLRVLGKGSVERIVPLGRSARAWLARYLREERPRLTSGGQEKEVWIAEHGERLSWNGVRRIFRTRSDQAGLKATIAPHAFRRACATHMLRNNAHPVQIQHLLGHQSVRTLNHYLRVTIMDLKKTHSESRLAR